MKKLKIGKFLAAILSLTICIFMAIGFAACGSQAPYIGEDGYWYVDGQKTEYKAEGEKGDKGDKGDAGENGSSAVADDKVVDLVMFMGQSNMAGRGVAAESPVVPEGQGYEFRAMTDPTRLYPATEPFGKNENNASSGVSESTKTGGMVSSFMIEYYQRTGVPIVGVSCAKGGTQISFWAPNGKPLNDAISRHDAAKNWLTNNGYTVRNDFMVWCQGCSDGDNNLPKDTYKQSISAVVNEMMGHGIQKAFIVRIGNLNGNPTKYDEIIAAQTEYCRESANAVLVSTKLAGFAEQGLMKDSFHYKQEGYNIVGKDAGMNTAFYINNGIEPYMYDIEYKNVYFPYADLQLDEGGETDVDSEELDPSYVEKLVEFNFDQTTENGVDLSQAGTVSGGKITLDGTSPIALAQPITISLNESFTFEFTVRATKNSGVILGVGASTGGFINIPSPTAGDGSGFTLRDTNRTASLLFNKNTQTLGGIKHFVMIYNKTANKLTAYEDGQEMTLTNQTGSLATLQETTFRYLFGGLGSSNYIGDVYHIRYVNRVLTKSEWKTDEGAAASAFASKTVSVFGDSISSFAGVSNDTSVNSTMGSNSSHYSNGWNGFAVGDTWWKQLVDSTGMTLIANNSSAGDSMALKGMSRCVQLHNNANQNPDVICMFFGINDIWRTLSEPSTYTFSGFQSNYTQMLSAMQTKYPDAIIFASTYLPFEWWTSSIGSGTVFKMTDEQLEAYNDFVRQTIAATENVYLVDLYRDSGINFDNYKSYMVNETNRWLHPNQSGMDKITDCFYSAMEAVFLAS